jgi:DNA polymerase-3 subunit epsilon
MTQIREIILDTETTGLYPKNGDRLIEIGCVELIDKVRTGRYYHTYVNPQKEISPEAFKVHGLSLDFLSDKPIFRKIADDFLNFIGTSTMVIHNAGFDLAFLNHELALQGYPPLNSGRVVDTLLLARKKFPGAPASLDALCKKYGVSLESRNLHGALIDAELLAQVYVNLTGGAQKTIELSSSVTEIKKINTVTRKIREVRTFTQHYTEIEAHEEYVQQNFPNSNWYKKVNDS